MEFDTTIRHGLIIDVISGQDIGIRNGQITCIGLDLPASPSTSVIDAERAYITPGGVDSHVDLEQWNTPTGGTLEIGSRNAICGGTTTVVAFASQNKHHDSVILIFKNYTALAKGRSSCNYGIRLILTNPTQKIVDEELPLLHRELGITSIKLYMTYGPMKLRDREILDIMIAARKLEMTTMIHAENHDMIDSLH